LEVRRGGEVCVMKREGVNEGGGGMKSEKKRKGKEWVCV
jgi:hypothetical protein